MKHNYHTYHTYNTKHTCHTYHTYLTQETFHTHHSNHTYHTDHTQCHIKHTIPNRLTYHTYHPYNTNHSCHTYHTYHTYHTFQTCHTKPTIHTIHTQQIIPHPHHTTGGEGASTTSPPHHGGGGRFDTGAVYGTHSIRGEGGWQGLVHILYSICIVIYTARSVAANSSACSIDMSLRNDQKADYRRQLQQLSKAQTVLHSRTDRSPDSPEMSDSGSSFRNDTSFQHTFMRWDIGVLDAAKVKFIHEG